jgi:hypothetical protein
MTATDRTTDRAAASPLEAAAAHRPWPASTQTTEALLAAERLAKRQRSLIEPQALLGTWRLRFTAPKKPVYKAGKPTGKGFYVPGLAVATLRFSQEAATGDRLTLENQLQLGPLKLRFTGPAKALPKKNLVAFDFVRCQLFLGPLTLLNLPLRGRSATEADFAATPVAKLPFFAFFAAQDDYIAARGRGGGLALWVKVPEG